MKVFDYLQKFQKDWHQNLIGPDLFRILQIHINKSIFCCSLNPFMRMYRVVIGPKLISSVNPFELFSENTVVQVIVFEDIWISYFLA